MAEIDDNSGERTEQPTALRLEEARRRGLVPRSGDLVSAATLLGGAGLLALLGGRLLEALVRMVREMLAWGAGPLPLGGLTETLVLLALLLGGLAVSAVGINLAQVGPLVAWERVVPDLARLSPSAGLGRLLSARMLMGGAMAVLKTAAVGVVACAVLLTCAGELASAGRLSPQGLLGLCGRVVTVVALAGGAALAVLAVLDLLFQRWQYRRELMMTRREVRQELRRNEGDPALRRRRRKLSAEAAASGRKIHRTLPVGLEPGGRSAGLEQV